MWTPHFAFPTPGRVNFTPELRRPAPTHLETHRPSGSCHPAKSKPGMNNKTTIIMDYMGGYIGIMDNKMDTIVLYKGILRGYRR